MRVHHPVLGETAVTAVHVPAAHVAGDGSYRAAPEVVGQRRDIGGDEDWYGAAAHVDAGLVAVAYPMPIPSPAFIESAITAWCDSAPVRSYIRWSDQPGIAASSGQMDSCIGRSS